MPIEPTSKDIQIGSNSTHIIKRMQFPIPLATTRIIHQTQGTHIIHQTQGLTLHHLAFDPNGEHKHGS
jgi:hypothetical protein